jgi:hypothetical protein
LALSSRLASIAAKYSENVGSALQQRLWFEHVEFRPLQGPRIGRMWLVHQQAKLAKNGTWGSDLRELYGIIGDLHCVCPNQSMAPLDFARLMAPYRRVGNGTPISWVSGAERRGS